MNYNEALDYLYAQHPAYERQGNGAYKPGLDTARQLDQLFGEPQQLFKSIHIAGTNGKGSVAHIIAAALQRSGYKVGLFTSPHLVDFRERIRVNGRMIPRARVALYVKEFKRMKFAGQPTFFELCSAMAFRYFADVHVDYAIIETGLGGRLDSTNIITPILSIITNIALDHTQLLGDTLEQIAAEKAGIIKPGVPVVVGEARDEAVRNVLLKTALQQGSRIIFATDERPVLSYSSDLNQLAIATRDYGVLNCQLTGEYQVANARTIIVAIRALIAMGLNIDSRAVKSAFAHVCTITGLQGRWQVVDTSPLIIGDSGHNPAAFEIDMKQLNATPHNELHLVLGFMADKDIDTMLGFIPEHAHCYLTRCDSPRALDTATLVDKARAHGLDAIPCDNVVDAYAQAKRNAGPRDIIFVGGSMYLLGEFLNYINANHD